MPPAHPPSSPSASSAQSSAQEGTPAAALNGSATACLQGLRVVDLTQVIAGPYCGLQLALLGAQVTKVEALSGDPLRWRGGSAPVLAARGLSTHYQAQAAGRQVLHIDWNGPEGLAQLHTLLAQADVLVCNLRAHVLARLDLSPSALRARYPRLVVCTLAGYGGPTCAAWPAYDNTIQAASGLMRLGSSASAGARVGAPIMDYASGMAALAGILAALVERARSGQGQHVAVNMLAVAHQLMSAQRTDLALTGNEPTPKGNRANSGEPLSRVFETAQGHLALAVNEEHQFAKLTQALGQPLWLQDARFASAAQRRQHSAQLEQAVQELLMEQSAAQWEQQLNAAGVACAWVRSLAQSLQHPGAQTTPRLFELERGAREPGTLTPPQSPPANPDTISKETV